MIRVEIDMRMEIDPSKKFTPLDRFIKERECETITGLSRPTRWRMMKNGSFPKSYKLNPSLEGQRQGAVGWKSSELGAWLKYRENWRDALQ
jgi:prophage regulatory protein